MKAFPPIVCGTLLVAMAAAGLSHHWSVRTFVEKYPVTSAIRVVPTESPFKSPTFLLAGSPENQRQQVNPDLGTSAAQKEFFDSLLAELKDLRNENRDLRDLMGETNRDVMKLAFRVDTHSESFRPLPTSEEREDNTSFEMNEDEFPGVLPPKASPVYPLDE